MKNGLLFFSRGMCENLKKIVGRVLSIPVSDSFVERIFSLMGQCWTDERNRMRSELVKAELIVKVNFGMSCAEFHDFVTLPAQKPLLKCSMQTAKYRFKWQCRLLLYFCKCWIIVNKLLCTCEVVIVNWVRYWSPCWGGWPCINPSLRPLRTQATPDSWKKRSPGCGMTNYHIGPHRTPLEQSKAPRNLTQQ